jgi:hypothetical protein
VAVDGQGVTEIQESAIAPREATDHPVPVRITPAGDGFHAAKVRQLAELASLEERYRHELMDD